MCVVLKKYIVESDVKRRRVIEHFFFCNNEQIRLARRLAGVFLLDTNATFNTNRLNLPLSTLIDITCSLFHHIRIGRKVCLHLLMSGKNPFFNDECPGPGVTSGGFAAGSNSAVIQKSSTFYDGSFC